jgi:hypothetical protein
LCLNEHEMIKLCQKQNDRTLSKKKIRLPKLCQEQNDRTKIKVKTLKLS